MKTISFYKIEFSTTLSLKTNRIRRLQILPLLVLYTILKNF